MSMFILGEVSSNDLYEILNFGNRTIIRGDMAKYVSQNRFGGTPRPPMKIVLNVEEATIYFSDGEIYLCVTHPYKELHV